MSARYPAARSADGTSTPPSLVHSVCRGRRTRARRHQPRPTTDHGVVEDRVGETGCHEPVAARHAGGGLSRRERLQDATRLQMHLEITHAHHGRAGVKQLLASLDHALDNGSG